MDPMIRKLLLVLVFFSLFSNSYPILILHGSSNSKQTSNTFTFTYDQKITNKNPLKGFMPYSGDYDSFPHSMEFFYTPLMDLMQNMTNFTFDTGLEPQLEEISSRNHHAVFRVYLDYPSLSSGIPSFLRPGLKINEYSEYGGGTSPDYTNESLIKALEVFISELGRQYDGDPCIGFLQIGLLGFWGEWHTYPHEEWFPNETIQNRILYAFDSAFNETHILVRYPLADSPSLLLGFHDDSFAYETLGPEDWQFHPSLVVAGLEDHWHDFPIGGELRPEIQPAIWKKNPPENTQDYNQCVDLTHTSWLLNQEVFDNTIPEEDLVRAEAGALRLGYEYSIEKISQTTADQESNTIDIYIRNTGVAPFYYPLELSIKLESKKITIVGLETLLPKSPVIKLTTNFPVGKTSTTYSITLKSPFLRDTPIFLQ